MPLEPSEINPAMSPDMAAPAQGFDIPAGEHDHEGAMAKADLYKLANYSLKLFKQMDDGDQLESWVQAKITKAADYIASVYHYLQYEMKFSEYGHHLDNSDTLSEGQKMKIKELLAEAKDKMKELKKQQAEKAKKVEEGILSGGERPCTECGGSGMVYEEPKAVPDHVKSKVEKYKKLVKATKAAHKRMDANNNGIPDDEEQNEGFDDKSKEGDTFKTRTGVATKTSTGVKHVNTSHSDEEHGEPPSKVKSKSAAEKKKEAPALKKSKSGTWGMEGGEKFDNRKKEKTVDEMYGQGVYEGKKKGDGNLANNAKPYDKVTRGDVIAGRLGKDEEGGKKKVKEDNFMPAKKDEQNPLQKVASTVKKIAKGEKPTSMQPSVANNVQESKPSAGLSKKEKSAVVKKAKAGGDIGKPGKSFDKVAKAAGGGEKGKKIAAAAMWKNIKEGVAYLEEKKAAAKADKDYDNDGKIETGPEEHAGAVDNAIKAAKKETVKESVVQSSELTRMQEQLGRLNRNESIQVTESAEVAQLRKLTKLLG